MLDAVAAIFAVILVRGFLVSVEGAAHSEVSDGMGIDLKVALVERSDCGLILRDVPEERALGGGIIGIRFDHGRGVCFDDAIELEFDGTGLNPFVMEFFVCGLDGVQVLRAELVLREAIGDAKANG